VNRAVVVAALALAIASCRCTPKTEPGAEPIKAPAPSASVSTRTTPKSNQPDGDDPMDAKGCPKLLEEARRGGAVRGAYVPPTDAETSGMSRAMNALASGREDEAKKEAAQIGFRVVDVPEMAGVAALVEGERRRGGGAYLVRRGSTSKLVVQAPHTFFDEGTLPLGCAFFEQSKARALFVNTAHRNKGAPNGENGGADVAHLPHSLFQSATEGIVLVLGASSVLQLHGFDNRPMKVVVSSGEPRPGIEHVARVAKELDAIVGGGVARFPEDPGSEELGAKTNVQGKLVRARGGLFLHIEMRRDVRTLFIEDAAKRTAAFAAIAASMP
jgi:hypothetical protein